jgi:hypothetical protein
MREKSKYQILEVEIRRADLGCPLTGCNAPGTGYRGALEPEWPGVRRKLYLGAELVLRKCD